MKDEESTKMPRVRERYDARHAMPLYLFERDAMSDAMRAI